MKKFIAVSLSDVVFIMLINVKMPTIVAFYFNIYEQDKILAQLSCAWKKFYNLLARFVESHVLNLTLSVRTYLL